MPFIFFKEWRNCCVEIWTCDGTLNLHKLVFVLTCSCRIFIQSFVFVCSQTILNVYSCGAEVLFFLLYAVLFTAACTILLMHFWMPSAGRIFVSLWGVYGVEAMQKPTKSRSGSVSWVQIWSHIIYTSRRLKSAKTIPRNQRERKWRRTGTRQLLALTSCLSIYSYFFIALLFMFLWPVASVFFITNTVCSVAKIMLPAGLFSQCFCYKYSFVLFLKLLVVSSSWFWSDFFQCWRISLCDMSVLFPAFFKTICSSVIGAIARFLWESWFGLSQKKQHGNYCLIVVFKTLF